MNDINGFLKRRWPAMIASLLICICAGFGYAWSVLQTPIIAAHGWPDQQVSLTYTVTVLCSTMAPLFFGGLIRRLGTRRCVVVGAVLFGAGLMATGWISGGVWQLYLFYGVLSGLGTGFVYPAMMAYVVRLFPEKSGMASGLGTAAYGSRAILWAPGAGGVGRRVFVQHRAHRAQVVAAVHQVEPHGGRSPCGLRLECHLRAPCHTALLGRDEDYAVRGAGTVDTRRSGVLQHLDRLDVREVERRQRTHVLAERIERRRVVRQRNAVDHVKRLVAGAERRRTADAHLLGRAEVTRTGRDRHAGDAVLK